ncbi:hypothetical protein IGI04_003504, partial [Brassica rapa subsp. trilocularis]
LQENLRLTDYAFKHTPINLMCQQYHNRMRYDEPAASIRCVCSSSDFVFFVSAKLAVVVQLVLQPPQHIATHQNRDCRRLSSSSRNQARAVVVITGSAFLVVAENFSRRRKSSRDCATVSSKTRPSFLRGRAQLHRDRAQLHRGRARRFRPRKSFDPLQW